MPSPTVYSAATGAITKLLQTDINNLVPSWAKGFVPAGIVPQIAPALARAAVDAAFAQAAKEQQAPPPPEPQTPPAG